MKLFFDSSALISRFLKRDKNHKKTIDILEKITENKMPYSRFFTSNYVVDETVTYLLYKGNHEIAKEALKMLRTSQFIQIFHVSEEIERLSDMEFRKFSDHTISYTDCTSKVLMEKYGIDTIFTFDQDFNILGFKTIP